MAEKLYTQADMDAVRKLYRENTLSAVRITVDEMRSRYDPTCKCEFAPSRPHTAHERYIDQLGARLAQADAIIRAAGEDQARVKAKAGPTTATVVQMASAREIIEAGRKRRGGT
jgi:hypothetical protein